MPHEDRSGPADGLSAAAMLRRLALGSGLAFALIVAGKALLYLLHILLARLSGAEQYGLYVYAMGWAGVVVLVAKMGLDTAALRFLPEHLGRGETALARGFLARSGAAVLLASAALAAAAAAAVLLLRGVLGAGVSPVLLLACLLVPVSALTQVVAACLRALGEVPRSLVLLNILQPLLSMGGAFLAFRLLGRPLHASDIMLLTTASLAGPLLLGLAWLRPALAARAPGPGSATASAEWIRCSARLFLVSLWLFLLTQADILILGSLRPKEEVGIYRAASYAAAFCVLGLEAVNMLAAPLIARLHGSRRTAELQQAVRAAARIGALTALPAAALLVLLGPAVLGLFGQGFAAGYVPLVILCAGTLLTAFAGQAGLLLTMTGHERDATRIYGWTAAANLALCAAFVRLWGATGAAAAMALTWVARDGLCAFYAHRRTGIVSWCAGPSPRPAGPG